jgi:hypothetical protein
MNAGTQRESIRRRMRWKGIKFREMLKEMGKIIREGKL